MERRPKSISFRELNAAVRTAVRRTQERYPDIGLSDNQSIYFHLGWIWGIPPDWPLWDPVMTPVNTTFSDFLIDELKSTGLAESFETLEPAAYGAGSFTVIGVQSSPVSLTL
jgi:hypothetical protein